VALLWPGRLAPISGKAGSFPVSPRGVAAPIQAEISSSEVWERRPAQLFWRLVGVLDRATDL